jgi:hypothetical protein
MVVKRRVAALLSGTVIGASCLAAPAFAEDAQLQQQINSLQQQLQQLQDQVAAAKSAPSGLYNQAPPPGGPLAFKAPVLPGGVQVSFAGSFIEAATVWRQRNEISSGASDPAFSSLPFSNTPLYSENEWRASAQQSRLAIKFSGDIDPIQHLKAYYESDFLGAGVTANSRESNSYNLRIRQAWLSYDNDAAHFHVMAGQGWSMVTQNRVGIIPLYENVPLTIDAQYTVGFNWARQEQLRFVYDVNQIAWFGFSVEAPQAAIGGTLPASAVPAYPFAVNAANNCNNAGLLDSATYCSNDVAPDFVEKFALDPGWGHYEVFGLERIFADQVSPFVSATTPATWSTKTTLGWDVGGSFLVPAIPKYLDLEGNIMAGQGGGRYGSSQLSDVTYGANGALVALPYLGGKVGAVAHPWTGIDFYAYAGEEEVKARSFGTGADGYGNPLAINNGCLLANPAYPNNPGGIGAGSFNSAIAGTTCTANVRRVQELNFGVWANAYKGPMGRVAVGLEYEYVRLAAFPGVGTFSAGVPAAIQTPNQGLNPNNNIFFTSIRYYPF